MAYAGITDEEELISYEFYIRKGIHAAEFRSTVSLSFGECRRGRERKFTFDLTVGSFEISKLLILHNNQFMKVEPVLETPEVKRLKRISGKTEYSPATLAKYSKVLEKKINALFDEEMPDTNLDLRSQVIHDVMRRLNLKEDKVQEESSHNSMIVSNIRSLVISMRLHGKNDREQIKFLENISLAVSGRLALTTLEMSTGLSRRTIEHGREMREEFEIDVKKSELERGKGIQLGDEDITMTELDNESEQNTDILIVQSDVDLEDEEVTNVNTSSKSESRNIFRNYFSSQSRKLRSDRVSGKEVQLFCHESPWGGRVDTLRLSRQQVLLEQPLGGFEYETVRSFQYTITEMHEQFIKSEYGGRQKIENNGRDLSIARFRELICPCMTEAKQRDTADEIVAEFNHCLTTWDISMRKQNKHVRAEISRCSLTECPQHKTGSLSAEMYSKASKNNTHFLAYLLCPQIQRSELAVKVSDRPSNFTAELKAAKDVNIKAAEDKKIKRDADYRASHSTKVPEKKIKKERQKNHLPEKITEPGFGWYRKDCCELRCDDCGIKARLHAEDSTVASAVSAANTAADNFESKCCNCEFVSKDDNGEEIEVLVKVKLYKDQVRSGTFQKELEEIEMTLNDFKMHFIRCIKRYLKHHFNDIMSSQARRNLYEKMRTDPNLSTTLILASDYSAIFNGHSQDQLNQTTQLHSIQLVILISYLSSGVLMTKAYSFWTQQGATKLKSDNHYYRQCKNRVLEDARIANIPFDRVVEMTDGSPTQFKNRFNVVQLANVVRKFNLKWAMAVYPPTATFKGEHDGVGNLDKNIIRKAELQETGRFPTTRSYMLLLNKQKEMKPRPLDDINRRTHEIDAHIRVFVTERSHMMPGDGENHDVLVTNKSEENYECTTLSGIQSCYNIIVFSNPSETGELNKDQTAYLRDRFCSCDSCRKATIPDDFSACR